MNIIIDINESTPLFAQLIGQIKDAVLTDHLQPGAALPSIRQLANDLDINSKTVAKAYKLLERDLVIESKGYRGTFIHLDAKANCKIDLNESILTKLQKTISDLRNSGVTDSEIRIAFAKLMTNNNS